MTREESFKNISAPRDVTSLRQQWLNSEKQEWDPLDAAQQEFEDAVSPMALLSDSDVRRLLRASAESILGHPLTKPSPESSPSSTAAEVETAIDSDPEGGTKKQA